MNRFVRHKEATNGDNYCKRGRALFVTESNRANFT